MRRPIYVLVFGGVCDSANAAVCFCGGIDETTVDPAVASCRADRLFVCRVFRLQCVYHFQRPRRATFLVALLVLIVLKVRLISRIINYFDATVFYTYLYDGAFS